MSSRVCPLTFEDRGMGQGDIYAHTVALYNVFWKMNPEACCIPIMGKGRNTGGRSWATAKTVGLDCFPSIS